jgi:hypothetical protein
VSVPEPNVTGERRRPTYQAEKQFSADPRALRLGGGCVIIGSLAVGGFRLAHGDLPAADAEAALAFITEHPMYAGVHLGTVLGALVWVAGFVALSGTFRHGFARVLGRWAPPACWWVPPSSASNTPSTA